MHSPDWHLNSVEEHLSPGTGLGPGVPSGDNIELARQTKEQWAEMTERKEVSSL